MRMPWPHLYIWRPRLAGTTPTTSYSPVLDAHVRAKGEEGGARCPAFHQMAELMNDGLVKYRARKHEYLQLMRAANDGKLSRVSLYDKG